MAEKTRIDFFVGAFSSCPPKWFNIVSLRYDEKEIDMPIYWATMLFKRGRPMPGEMKDYHIRLQKIEFLAPKINQGLEFILVLSGELIVETNSRFYRLKEKDLLVLNRNQLYQMQGKDNSVLMLNISDTFIERYYPEFRNSRFECYSREVDMGRESMISTIQRLLAEIMITFYRKDESYRLEIQRNICEILLILIRRFKQEASAFEKFDSEDLRLTQLIDYMERNYQQIITLEDMAKKCIYLQGICLDILSKRWVWGLVAF